MGQEKYHILFVEDSQDYVESMVSWLSLEADIEIEYERVDSQQALQNALNNQMWDLMICDFIMPELAASDAIQFAQQCQPQTPIILLSGHASVQDAVDMMRLGARAFIKKNEQSRLIKIVREELDTSRRLRESFEMEAKVKEIEVYYQSVINHQREFVCRYNANFQLTFVNRAYCEFIDLPADELIGFNFISLIPEDQWHDATAHILALTIDNPTSTSTHKSIMPDGSHRWVEWTDVAIFNDDGEIIEYQGTGRDVTDQILATQQLEMLKQELETKSDQLQTILDTMQDALISISIPDRKVIQVSPSFEKIFGYPYQQFIDEPQFFKQVVHPDDLQLAIEGQATCLREGFVEFDHRIIKPSGEVRWVHRRAWVNYDEDHRPLSINDSARDITDRKLAERALQESETIYRLTLSNISDAVFITDDDGYLIFVYPNVNVLYGYTHQEVLAMDHISRVLGDSLFDVAELERSGEITNIEQLIHDKAGQPHYVLVTVKKIAIAGGTNLYTVHDITERKQAEQALRASEARLAEAQRIAHIGNWERNLATPELYWSDEVYRIFGFESQGFETNVDRFSGSVHPDDREYVHQSVQKAIAEHSTYSIDHRIVLPTGEIRFVHEEAKVIYDESDSPLRMVGTVQDITERKQTEQQLAEANERYLSLIESSDSGIIMVNYEGEILYGNHVYAEDNGLTLEQMLGKSIEDIYEDDVERRLKVVQQVIDSGQGTIYEIEQIRQGKARWYRASLQPVKNSEGEVTATLINSLDITDHKLAEQALQKSEQRFRMISELMSDSAIQFHIDEDGQVTQLWQFGVNPDEILGYSDSTSVSSIWNQDIVHPDDAVSQMTALQKTLAGEETTNIFRARAADGHYHWFEGKRKPIWNADHTRVTDYILAMKDITEQKEAEQALQKSEQRFRMISGLMLDTAIEYQVDEQAKARKIWSIGNDLAQVLGYNYNPLDTIISAANHTHPDDHPATQLLVEKTLAGHQTANEYRLRAKDGQYHWFLCRRHPIWDDSHTRVKGYMLAMKDITEQKESEQLLRQNEQRFRIISELMSDSAVEYRVDEQVRARKIWSIGNNLAQVLGYDNNTLDTVANGINYTHPDDREATQSLVEKTLAGQPTANEYRLRASNGQYNWFLCSRTPVWNDDQTQVTGYMLAMKDITEQKEAEQLLRQNEQRFRIISELMSDSAVEFQFDEQQRGSKIWSIGNDIGEILGYESDPLDTVDVGLDHVHPVDSEITKTLIAKTLAGHHTNNEQRFRNRDGYYNWFQCSRSPVWNDDQTQVTGYMLALKDITEQKETENKLDFHSAILRNVAEGVHAISVETGHIVYVNPTLEKMFGYDSDELIGQHLSILNSPTDPNDGVDVVNILNRDGFWEGEIKNIRKDGSDFWTYAKVVVFNHSVYGNVWLTVQQDISEQKAADEALRMSETRFQQFMKHLPATVTIQSADAQLIYCNEYYAKTIKQNIDEIIGKNLHEYLNERSMRYILEENRKITETQQTIQFDYEDQENVGKHWHYIKFPIPLTDGNIYIGSIATDITEKEQAKAELQKAHDLLEERVIQRTNELENTKNRIEAIFNSSSDGILLFDTERGILEANYTCDVMLGMMFESYRYQQLTSIIAPDDRHIVHALIEDVMDANSSAEIEVQVMRGDTIFDAEINISPVQQRDDTALQLVCTIHDISERKQAEAKLRKNEQLLRTIAANYPNSYLSIIELDYTIGFTSGQEFTKSGLDPDMFIGATLQQVFGEYAETIRDYYQKTFEGVGQTFELAFNDQHQLYRTVPLPAEDGSIPRILSVVENITERKKTEIAIAEERNLLRTVIDTVSEYIYVKDLDHRFLLINQAGAESVGYDDPMKVVGKTDAELFPENMASSFLADELEILATQKPKLNIEERSMGRGGNEIWALTSKAPLIGLDGELRGLVGITRDITSIKENEEALRRSEQEVRESQNMLQMVIDTIPVRVFWKDRDSTFLGCNELFAKDVGYVKPADIIGLTDYDIFVEEADSYRRDDAEVMTTGQGRLNYEEKLTISDDIIWLQTSKIPLRNAEGGIIGVLGTYNDITSRKQAEADLSALSQRLQLATEAGQIGVWDWNLLDDTVIWDDRMFVIYDIAPENFTGTIDKWAERIHPEDLSHALQKRNAAIEHNTPYDMEYRIILNNDTIRYIKTNAVVIRDDEGKALRMVGVNLDITDLKEAENALLAALDKEKELGELKSRFVSMASHEFRTPLASIMATTETLSVYRDRMNDLQIDDRLEKIRGQILHMKELMEDVLHLARMQAGRVEFKPGRHDIDVLCREIIEEFDGQKEYRGRIQYTCEIPTSKIITLDHHLMRQVINNLTHNALKYSDQDQSVWLTLSEVSGNIQLIVKDNGIGIPESDLKHLFEPFHRAKNVGTIPGTGLGLSITKQAIDVHRGEIAVESQVGLGTTFTLLIPKTLYGEDDGE